MTFGKRLKLFIEKCYDSQNEFSDVCGIDKTSMNRYIQDRIQPTINILTIFYNAGLSLEWIITGRGSMYADNEAGRALSIKVEEKKTVDSISMNRLKTWIEDNYNTFEGLADEAGIEVDEIKGVIFAGCMLNKKIFIGLKKAGCNIHWLLTGEGTSYENNVNGIKLKLFRDGVDIRKIDELRMNHRIQKVLKDSEDNENIYSTIKEMIKNEIAIGNMRVNKDEN